ncbi:tetratricopeptide repeat protein [Mariprofundus micogutta]|nr:tetratricopeptide repeat protein [Mariprofundus micogutta]
MTTTIPARAETPFQAALQYIESGQITEARRALESELRLRPDNLEARYNLAILLERIGHRDESETLYKTNINTGRHLPSVINLAGLLQDKGHFNEATHLLESATRQFKSEATPWYLLAQMAEKNGTQIEAIRLFQKALKADPLNGFAYLAFADYQSRHHMKGSGLKHGAKASRLLSTCAPCLRKYGDILHRAKKDKDALIAYQHSLAIDPNDKTRQQLVIALRSLGQHRRAEHIQRGLDARQKTSD